MITSDLEIVLRLALGFLAGAIIGFERSSRYQVAGLRTHILIATGATLLMILSVRLPLELNPFRSGDPGRIAAQVVSGIGFLGAGAILRLGNNIKGLTTAASLWLVAAVGMTIGAGMYLAAAAAEVLALLALIGLNVFEKRIFPAEKNKNIDLWYTSGVLDINKTLDILKSSGIRIQSMDLEQSENKGTRLTMLVGMPENTDLTELAKTLKNTGEIEHLEMKEKY